MTEQVQLQLPFIHTLHSHFHFQLCSSSISLYSLSFHMSCFLIFILPVYRLLRARQLVLSSTARLKLGWMGRRRSDEQVTGGHGAAAELTAESMLALILLSAPKRGLLRYDLFQQLYILYFVLSTFALLPLYTIRHALPSWRPRPTWSLSTSVRVRAKRRICGLVGTCWIDNLGRDLSNDPEPTTLKESHLVTISPVPEQMIRGHPREMLGLLRDAAERDEWTPHFLRPMSHTSTGESSRGGWKRDWCPRRGDEYGAAPVKAFWYAGEKPSPQSELPPVEPGKPVGLFFHGGAYICGTAMETDLTSNTPKSLLKTTPISRILSVDYRLAPQAPWPLPLLDAISSYHYLLSVGMHPRDIVVIGDSAGGHLAMALVRYLRDEGARIGVGMPGGLVLMSPWCDLGFTNSWGDGLAYNADSDLVDDTVGPFACSLLMRALPISLVYTSPYLSPGSQLLPMATDGIESMDRFPPTCIIYGGAERLGQSIQGLWERLCLSRSTTMGDVSRQSDTAAQFPKDELIEGEDCVHDFLIFPWQGEESAKVYNRLDTWLTGLCKEHHTNPTVAGGDGLELNEVDAENSPVLVPSWTSITESMKGLRPLELDQPIDTSESLMLTQKEGGFTTQSSVGRVHGVTRRGVLI